MKVFFYVVFFFLSPCFDKDQVVRSDLVLFQESPLLLVPVKNYYTTIKAFPKRPARPASTSYWTLGKNEYFRANSAAATVNSFALFYDLGCNSFIFNLYILCMGM